MNVDGTAVLGCWLVHCSANMHSGIRNVSAVFLVCDLLYILRRSYLMPEHAQRNRTRSLDFKSRVSYSTHFVFYILLTVHCDTHMWERPTWCTHFDLIYDTVWYGMIWYGMIYDIIYNIWYDIWYGMVWYDIWYDIKYDMVWYDMMYNIIWYDIFNCHWVYIRWQ
jgi:hypothetical protein